MKNKSFEEAIEELEKVVNELENENLSLDESVNKFQEGMKLSKYCNELLESAEKKISILVENSDGTIEEKSFDIDKREHENDNNME